MTKEEEEELLKKVALLEKQLTRTSILWRWRFVRPFTAVLLSVFATVGINIVYTTNAIRDNEQTWCDLVTRLDRQNQATPPPTENGKVFAQSIHTIVMKFHCK